MKITLTDTEVRMALRKAIESSTNYMFGECKLENCIFSITNTVGDIIELDSIEFTADFPDYP